MFTGIIETCGKVVSVRRSRSNAEFILESGISKELKIDQSVSHNGICLTVTACNETNHTVTAIDETLRRTNAGQWQVGQLVNLERCLQLGGRLDGHIVQGHVDSTGRVEKVEDRAGSWLYEFSMPRAFDHLMVEKGSICVDGVSLTVVSVGRGAFSVAIIPYTFENTHFSQLREGDLVNLEFDIVGKYLARMMALREG